MSKTETKKYPVLKDVVYRSLCLRIMMERAMLENLAKHAGSMGSEHPVNDFMSLVDDIEEAVKGKDESLLSKIEEIKGQAEEILQSDKSEYLAEIIKLRGDLKQWMESQNFYDYLSPGEKELFEKEPGSWEMQELANVSWRIEALGVLLWALELTDKIPGYDKQFNIESFIDKLPFMESIEKFKETVKMRSKKEIEKARDIAQLWHWRARTTRIMQDEEAETPKGYTYDGIIKMTAENAFDENKLPEPIDGDFPAFEKPYRDLTDEEFSIASSIALERHFALNWLSGLSENWDDTPTDT